MEGKIVHEELYKNYTLQVSARYSDNYGIKVDDEWYNGYVFLSCAILDRVGNIVENIDNYSEMFGSDEKFAIRYKRKTEGFNFRQMKSKVSLVHIADEYDRVFPLFLDFCKEAVDRLIKKANRNKDCSVITDGLPDSLRSL